MPSIRTGPTSRTSPSALLETLASLDVTATFFVQGRWAEAYPDVARSIADGGHLVGNHSHYHARMPLLTDDGLATDIADAGGRHREPPRASIRDRGSAARSGKAPTIRGSRPRSGGRVPARGLGRGGRGLGPCP